MAAFTEIVQIECRAQQTRGLSLRNDKDRPKQPLSVRQRQKYKRCHGNSHFIVSDAPKPLTPDKLIIQSLSTTPPDFVRGFVRRHGLEATPAVGREEAVIRLINVVVRSVMMDYGGLDDAAFADPAIGVIFKMLERNFEHVEAAIVAVATHSRGSAEVIARAAIESSVNILYILAGNRGPRMHAYLDYYFSEVDRQVKNWREAIKSIPPSETAAHEQGAQRRQDANNVMRDRVGQLGLPPKEIWPRKIEQRFQLLGLGIDYRTIYTRLGSESHADAEEIIRELLGKVYGDINIHQSIKNETLEYTRFMIYISASYFIKACIHYADRYSLPNVQPLRDALTELETSLLAISSQVGAF